MTKILRTRSHAPLAPIDAVY